MPDTFALRTNDGDIWPEQVAYVNGYAIEEWLLEDVRFKVEVIDGQLVCNVVHPEDQSYVNDCGNTARIRQWCDEAVAHMVDNDGCAMTEDGETELHWSDNGATPAISAAKPRMIAKSVPSFLRGRDDFG